MHPQRNTFVLRDGLTISSNFDNGNLWKCINKELVVTPENNLSQQNLGDSTLKNENGDSEVE